MRLRARTDSNHQEIVQALRRVGCSVCDISRMGKGIPDLIVGRQETGRNYLLEIKDGENSQSRQKLTPDERKWHDLWRGQVSVVSSVKEAYEAVGIKIEGWV